MAKKLIKDVKFEDIIKFKLEKCHKVDKFKSENFQ